MIVVTSMDKLPHSCMSCPFQKNQKTPFCRAKRNWYRPFEDVPPSFGFYIKEWDFSEGQTPWSARAKWCPLVEVPDHKDEPKRGEWIPCSERLPSKGVAVLVNGIMEDAPPITISTDAPYYYERGWINAWMPLPELYEEGE